MRLTKPKRCLFAAIFFCLFTSISIAQEAKPSVGLDFFLLKGRVLDTAGKALPKVQIQLFTIGLCLEKAAVAETATDSRGQYSINIPESDSYLLQANKKGYSRIAKRVTVYQGQLELPPIELTMHPAASIRGKVTLHGKPVEGAHMAVRPGDVLCIQCLDNQLSAQTDASGWYEINNIPAGPCLVLVRGCSPE